MTQESIPEISVVVYENDEYRSADGSSVMRAEKSLKLDEFSDNFRSFVDFFQQSLASIEPKSDGFTLSEFELKAEIGSTGKISLLGSGVSVSGSGCVSVKFTRKS